MGSYDSCDNHMIDILGKCQQKALSSDKMEWDGVYEASKSDDIADRYVDAFADEIAAKRLFPFSGAPLQYRGLFTGFYSASCKKYKAFYRVRDNYIEVIRIIMAKRDYMTILFGEPEES